MITSYSIALLLVAATAVYYYVHRKSNYWKRKGIPSYGNIVTGCFADQLFLKRPLSEVVNEARLKMKKEKVIGTFLLGQPILLVNEPEIVKQVLISDFVNFNSRGINYDLKMDPMSGHLFALAGADWKNMRTKLSPIFTSGKLKQMFPTLLECVHKMDTVLDPKQSTVIDTLFVISAFSIQVISSVAFGMDADCIENADSQLAKFGRALNPARIAGFLRFIITTSAPWLIKLLRMKLLTGPVEAFFRNLVRDTIDYRETNNVTRNDFMDLMIRLKNSGTADGSLPGAGLSRKGLTEEEMAAQALIFFFAGFETTSQANTFTLLEMAKNPDIQRRVQAECDKVLKETGGEITYDAVNGSMPYTEQVLKETMRMYSALPVLTRRSVTKCKIPLTDFEIDKDTTIWIPNASLHRDPEFFPEPEKFNPDRFSEENKSSIQPGVYMPFGDGPRLCIGSRFAMVQMKTLMMYLMSRFNVELTPDTDTTVKYDPRSINPYPAGKYYLKFSPRSKAGH